MHSKLLPPPIFFVLLVKQRLDSFQGCCCTFTVSRFLVNGLKRKKKRKGTKNEENTSVKQCDGSEISNNVSINTQFVLVFSNIFFSSLDYTTSQGYPREDNYFHAPRFSRLENVEFREKEKNCYPLSSRLERGTRRCKVE